MSSTKFVEKLLIFVIFIAVAQCANVTDIKRYDPKYGETWMFFPDGNGNPQIIELALPDKGLKWSLAPENPDSKIQMWLYNKKFRETPRLLKATGSNNRENFTLDENYDGARKTKIIIHGWKNSLNSDIIQLIKNAYLDETEDINIVCVDWGELAGDNNYLRSVAATQHVGKNVATVIEHMVVKHNANINDFHVIGHSLGAHTAGYTGMFIQNGIGKKIGRITGLDPAYPGFKDTDKIEHTLDPSDGQFVDVIHTCSGMLGHNENLGHADFFPNGGKAQQPGCNLIQDFVGSCSHGRSYLYFAESIYIKNGFMAFECPNWSDYAAKNCTGDPVPMGEITPNTARGTFFLETLAGPRYARLVKIN